LEEVVDCWIRRPKGVTKQPTGVQSLFMQDATVVAIIIIAGMAASILLAVIRKS
jgi:hypothetical protein